MFPRLHKHGDMSPEASLVSQVEIREMPSDGQYSAKITTASGERLMQLEMGWPSRRGCTTRQRLHKYSEALAEKDNSVVTKYLRQYECFRKD
jgi:hypothetical protein